MKALEKAEGRGSNPYYAGNFDGESDELRDLRLTLVAERDALKAENALLEEVNAQLREQNDAVGKACAKYEAELERLQAQAQQPLTDEQIYGRHQLNLGIRAGTRNGSQGMTDAELTLQARNVARCLTYNDDSPQAAAKHLLLEMAHRIDSTSVRVHKKRDGLLLINGVGKVRFATLKESFLYRIFGYLPRKL